MVLIGIASTGPLVRPQDPADGTVSKSELATQKLMELLRENYKISKNAASSDQNPATSWSLKKTFQKDSEMEKDPSKSVFADINHSHLCLIGDETSAFGYEVPFRSEVERYAAEKFGVPMLQFVFGGGPNTVATTLGFQNAPSALSCIVKGSGRFCHAIERYNELEANTDDVKKRESRKDCVGWLLQTSMNKLVSNHEISQIKSITDNKDKYSSPLELVMRFFFFICIFGGFNIHKICQADCAYYFSAFFLICYKLLTVCALSHICAREVMSRQDDAALVLKFQTKIQPASIAQHLLFCRSAHPSTKILPSTLSICTAKHDIANIKQKRWACINCCAEWTKKQKNQAQCEDTVRSA
jgi:hypothetical protein